jgi:hypothetical protein
MRIKSVIVIFLFSLLFYNTAFALSDRVVVMKKKICLMLVVACLVLSQFAHAGTVDVFGYTWETTEGIHEQGANPEILYTVNNPDSITATGIFPGFTSITTPLSISPGDVLSYDRYLSNEMRDRVGLGIGAPSNWLNYYQSHPLDTTGVTLDAYFVYAESDRDTRTHTTATGWLDMTASGAKASTGLHFEFGFVTATTYYARITDIVNGTQVAAGVGTLDISTVANWQFGMWETEQDMTIENFQVTSGSLSSPTISLDKSSYYSNEDITITWSDGSGSGDDRVALYLSCAAPSGIGQPQAGAPLAWADVSDASGQITIDNVLVPGDYVAVYNQYGAVPVSNFVNFSVTAGPATGRTIEPKMLLSYCDGVLADPQMYKEGSTYYITGTYSGTHGPIYSTDDFVTINTQWMEFDTGAWDNIWAFEIYKHTDGTYHGYGYIYGDGLYHFVPDPDPSTTTFPILKWRRASRLNSDYDNNVIYDGTNLWLFSAYQSEGSGHIPTYVHRMSDPDTIDPAYTGHRLLSENGDWLTSELRNRMGAMKIHEGTSPVQITVGGITKWVAPYTVGDYANRRYKIGFAYSDVLVPPAGTEYTKARKTDTKNVWASGAGANEVVYVTQTEKPSWPNYHGAIYGNPGSGDIFEYNGSYYMLFHATQPMMMDDMVGGSSYFGRSLWVVPLDFDFTGSMDTWAKLDLPDGKADPVLTPSKSIFAPGEDIVINFENAGQGAWDWIGLHRIGTPANENFDGKYVQGLSSNFLEPWAGNVWTWENTTYGFSGSMIFSGVTTEGDYMARFFFAGGSAPVAASCNFTVSDQSPFEWNGDPIYKQSAVEGWQYADTLTTNIDDPDGDDVLTYSLISDPAWLTVAADGQLSGVPADADTGQNEFTVRATNESGFFDDTTLKIYVANRYTGELGLVDLANFASRWLDFDCGTCGGTDLNGDGDTDMEDMAIFAGYWLK